MARPKSTLLNPRTTHFEFFGPIGVTFVFLTTSLLPYLLYFACEQPGQCPPSSVTALVNRLQAITLAELFNAQVCLLYIGWFLYLVVLYYVVPGSLVPGTELRTGERLTYRINGFRSLLVTCGLIFLLHRVYGPAPFIYITDHFVHWITAAWLFATLQALFLYVRSFRNHSSKPANPPVLLALGGNSSNWFYDFFIGRELNPRVLGGTLDLKVFCELRPGIIGWLVLNFSFLIKQAQALDGYITESMALIFFLQGLYTFDTFIYESSVLTTMDVTTDGFGWMLSFGDLAWVPFIFSIQARYLALEPVLLGPVGTGLVVAVGIASFLIFRLSNSQKNIFRTNPHDPRVRGLKYIETESGSKLLISGWWGLARHINYLGDWLFGLSWCLTTGFGSPIPYFYIIYFGILLIHRERRDDHKCRLKYKQDWDRYCSIVKYRIVPGIY
ncbi:C-14 sterol reductase [Dimargaris cristalligena]|uniref:Delta(14)-sterol reductase n=1 Tax=Dimargaris cristalligena TaxID=215637 RepID=A0A4P9ZN22_9FUNG|nr:C-14 sterol reductase [Dimargaris cristalligena]|eukprot:RKP34806.1 C-14 sterol reductase [Dimargaris cristalligena]